MALDEERNSLMDRYRDYSTYYSDLYSEMEDAKEYYDSDFDITKPEDMDKMIPPTARSRVDVAVTELITDEPNVTRRRLTGDDQADNDAIELALTNFLMDAENYIQTPVLHEAGKLQIVRGGVFLAGPFYDLEDRTAWYDVFDPLTVYIEPGAKPREAFVHVELPIAEMEQLGNDFPQFRNYDRKGKRLTESVTLVQWWSHEPRVHGEGSGRYAAWLEEETDFLVPPRPSGYPYLPVDLVPSGWGLRSLGSSPKDVFVSLLFSGARNLLLAEAELFTMLHARARTETWRRYKLPSGIELPQGFKIETLPDSITRDWPMGLEPIEELPYTDTITRNLDLVDRSIDDTLFSRILQGQRQPGVGTATAYMILTGRARKRFDPPLRMLQAGVARLLRRVGLLSAYLEKKLRLEDQLEWRGAPLKSSYYRGDFAVSVDLRAEDLEEKRLKIQEGLQLWEKIPDKEVYERYWDLKNWTEAQKQRLLDKIYNSPEFTQSVLQMYGVAVENMMRGRRAEAEAAPQEAPEVVLRRLASATQAARQGYPPAQPGTVEGIAQQTREIRRAAMSPFAARGY